MAEIGIYSELVWRHMASICVRACRPCMPTTRANEIVSYLLEGCRLRLQEPSLADIQVVLENLAELRWAKCSLSDRGQVTLIISIQSETSCSLFRWALGYRSK